MMLYAPLDVGGGGFQEHGEADTRLAPHTKFPRSVAAFQLTVGRLDTGSDAVLLPELWGGLLPLSMCCGCLGRLGAQGPMTWFEPVGRTAIRKGAGITVLSGKGDLSRLPPTGTLARSKLLVRSRLS